MNEKNTVKEEVIAENKMTGELIEDFDTSRAVIEEKTENCGEVNLGEQTAEGYADDERTAAPAADAAGDAPEGERAEGLENPEDASEMQQFDNSPEGADEATESPRGGALAEISNSDMRRIMADPMFICFAKGKNSDIETLCRDFCQMIACGENARAKSNLDSSVLMRVTPYAEGTIRSGVILTERQRMLAREAGMTYREYYELINDIPERITK
ncbi:MAG: hypothetical protein IJR55_00745 [Clostridia bacterium]|nr:hypothetical protein [Clostridia bacterium]